MIHRQPASNGDTNAGHTPQGSRRPGHYGVDRVTQQNLEVVRADAERNLLLVRGPVPGPKNGLVVVSQSVKAKASDADAAGHRLVRARSCATIAVPEAFAGDVAGEDQRDLPRGLPRARQPARRHGTRRSSATKSPAAVASPGSKRAPAARAKARSARRSGVTAASSSDRSRAATSARSTRRNAARRWSPRWPTSYQNGAVTLLATDGLALTKTKELATLLFGSPKAAKTGAADAASCSPRASSARSARPLLRAGNNLTNAARHAHRRARHQGRRRLRAARPHHRRQRRAGRPLRRDGASPHDRTRHYLRPGDHREVDGRYARSSSTPSKSTRAPRRRRSSRRSARSSKSTSSRSTPSTSLGKSKNFARRGVRTHGKQSDWKKAIVTLAPGQKIELGGVNYFEQ